MGRMETVISVILEQSLNWQLIVIVLLYNLIAIKSQLITFVKSISSVWRQLLWSLLNFLVAISISKWSRWWMDGGGWKVTGRPGGGGGCYGPSKVRSKRALSFEGVPLSLETSTVLCNVTRCPGTAALKICAHVQRAVGTNEAEESFLDFVLFATELG
jgi:hypothetical protein